MLRAGPLPAPQPGTVQPPAAREVEIEPEMPVVALTFDDGPRRPPTGRLLDELALREVPATFFLLGHRLQGNEELVRRMARRAIRSASTPLTTSR